MKICNSMGGANCQYSETNFGHIYLVEDMAMSVLEDKDPMISGEEVLKAVDIILAACKLSDEKREIKLTK